MNIRELLDAGPTEVLTAASREPPPEGNFQSRTALTRNFHVLAQSCAMNAYRTEDQDLALRWTDAAVACYELAGRLLPEGVLRQSLEVPSYGLRTAMILKFGARIEPASAWLQSILEWLRDGMRPFASASAFAHALDPEHEGGRMHAIILLERIRVAAALWREGLFDAQDDLDAWFRAVEAASG